MTESKKSEKSTVLSGSDQSLFCAKCGEPNARHSNTCFACGECGKRLHRSLWQKLEKRVFKRGTKLTSFQIGLLIVAVYITYRIIVKLAQMSWGSPPE